MMDFNDEARAEIRLKRMQIKALCSLRNAIDKKMRTLTGKRRDGMFGRLKLIDRKLRDREKEIKMLSDAPVRMEAIEERLK